MPFPGRDFFAAFVGFIVNCDLHRLEDGSLARLIVAIENFSALVKIYYKLLSFFVNQQEIYGNCAVMKIDVSFYKLFLGIKQIPCLSCRQLFAKNSLNMLCSDTIAALLCFIVL